MKHALRRPFLAAATAAAAAAATALVPAAPALAGNPQSDQATTQGFRKAVTVAGITEHLQALQAVSNRSGGNRVGGSVGHERSADYVVARLQAAGYTVTENRFVFPYDADRTPAVFAQTAPTQTAYVDGKDFSSMTFSPNGDVTAPLYAVDLLVPAPGADNTSTSGCEAADFAGFVAGSIALVQRGTCPFGTKAANAAAAGAAAVVVFNEGQPGRTAPVAGTLGGVPTHAAPVVGTSFAIGDALRAGKSTGLTGTSARVRVDRLKEDRPTRNIIAETPGGDPDSVVVVGAHLDSVPRGPGINDNGSGSAGILEIAETMAERGITPANKVRFAWWSAEEFGLLGSRAYVAGLSAAELGRIRLNLNFDMIGSPNYARFVYDGDNSAFPVGPNAAAGPKGSGAIEDVFHTYFDAVGLPSAETPFSGRSDYGPFIEKGIPAGGLFTGAEGIKTAEQARLFGGTADQPYDACYHLACDTLANVSASALDEMGDAAAHAVLTFARQDFRKQPLGAGTARPRGTEGTAGGGGLHDDDHEPVAG